LSNRVPVFDRYTWLELGRDVTSGRLWRPTSPVSFTSSGSELPEQQHCTSTICEVRCSDAEVLSWATDAAEDPEDSVSTLEFPVSATEPKTVFSSDVLEDQAEQLLQARTCSPGWSDGQLLRDVEGSEPPAGEIVETECESLPEPAASEAEADFSEDVPAEPAEAVATTRVQQFYTLPIALKGFNRPLHVNPGLEETSKSGTTVSQVATEPRREHAADTVLAEISSSTTGTAQDTARYATLFTRLRQTRQGPAGT
ncbi:MAG: hypothetical protein KDA96_09835, partial [Planctomycetaceae bacterium]|nr:hypothetical protein [Planctomycetaceae bacterium]